MNLDLGFAAATLSKCNEHIYLVLLPFVSIINLILTYIIRGD
ncbi:hypothetical protein Plhal304r1_c025g0085301 [Plasmopara halstedii]